MIVGGLLFILSVLLSAFFSGSETGFYRATRVRMQLDAMSGDRTARGLVAVTNDPSLFVSTILVGNNLANFLTSFAVVLVTASISPQYRDLFSALAPFVLSPVVFVYGELLPKNLFFQAPNRLLRLFGPAVLFSTVVLLPVSGILWLLTRLLSFFTGEAPERMRLSLARGELRRVFDEGHEVGILRPTQQQLAHGMLSTSDLPLVRFAAPVTRIPTVRLHSSKAAAMRVGRRNQDGHLLVAEPQGRRVLGFVRMVDLYLDSRDTVETFQTLMEIPDSETPVSALISMQTREQPVGRVTNAQGMTLGLVTVPGLLEALERN